MKRLLTLTICMLMVMPLITGCASTSETPSEEASSLQSVEASESAETEESIAPIESEKIDETVQQPEGYPSETIEFIVPAPAGANLDLITRSLNEVLDLGTALQITNMGGGSQTIGMMELAVRDGDGYSMGIVAFAGGVIQPQIVDVTYDFDSFRNVALTNGPDSYSICVSADSDVNSYDAFEEMLSGGNTIYWTSPNAGSPAHLAGLAYLKELGVTSCEYVSYTGTAEAMTALLSGDVSFLVTDDSVIATRQDEGQVTAILTLSDDRNPLLDVPCAEEIGINGMGAFDGFGWIVVPSNTPDEIFNWIKKQIDAAVASDEYQKFLENNKNVNTQTYTEQEIDEMLSETRAALGDALSLIE